VGINPITVLLAGATGLVGSEVLKRCIDNDKIASIIVPTRRKLLIEHRKVKNIVMDLVDTDRHAELSQAIASAANNKVHAYICCLGTTMKAAGSREAFITVDRELVCRLAEISKAQGADNAVFVSSVGATRQTSNFYLRIKGETEDLLENMKFHRLDILRPGVLLGPRTDERTGEAVAQKLSFFYNPLLRGRLRRFRAIPAAVVADAALQLSMENTPGVFVHENVQMLKIISQQIV
jgi:uncharacterized protein YbjT (DUF2867 family)